MRLIGLARAWVVYRFYDLLFKRSFRIVERTGQACSPHMDAMLHYLRMSAKAERVLQYIRIRRARA